MEPLEPLNDHIATHYISDLQPGMEDWWIRVRVTSKSRIIPPNEERFKTLLFVDLLDRSGEIRAVALHKFESNYYYNLLEVGHVYVLSNLLIQDAFSNQPPVIKNKYELRFQDDTKVLHCAEVPQISYNFTSSFSEILEINITERETNCVERFIDVIGILVNTCHVEEGVCEDTRNITLRDSTGELMVHLRGPRAIDFNFQGNPVVAIKRGYLTTYAEMKDRFMKFQQNVILADCYMIDPNIRETYELKNWYNSIDE